jgi:hypothetical protein
MNLQPNEGQNQAASLAAQLFGAAVDRIKDIPREAMQEACHQVGAGAHELAAALFSPTNSGYVMYPRGGKDDNGQQKDGQQQQEGQDKGGQEQQGQEHQQERGRSM